MEHTTTQKTFFDSPDRLENEAILNEIIHFKKDSIISQLLEGYPELTVIINRNRQIVAFNSKALEAFRANDFRSIVGKRVGEAINCIHSTDTESGCGTSHFCRECGAARAIKRTTDKEVISDEECRISIASDGNIVAMDFQVHTQPLFYEQNTYTMFTVRDISSNKRREALERIFFHDVLNTVQAVKGLSEILPELKDDENKNEIISAIISSTKQLMYEIKSQSALRSAEDGQLQPDYTITTSDRILNGISELYVNNPEFSDKKLKINYAEPAIVFTTDIALTVRSLGNLVKNALEASLLSDEVVVSVKDSPEQISFHVFNNSVIPQSIQLQLFQRSFSTKRNSGHGIGLYSVKLLVNQYLNGHVDFISNASDKTIFSIYLPKNQTVQSD